MSEPGTGRTLVGNVRAWNDPPRGVVSKGSSGAFTMHNEVTCGLSRVAASHLLGDEECFPFWRVTEYRCRICRINLY